MSQKKVGSMAGWEREVFQWCCLLFLFPACCGGGVVAPSANKSPSNGCSGG